MKIFFSKCLKEFNLSFIWTFFLHDSKNLSSSFFLKITQRIDFVEKIWFKELNFFLSMTQRIELIFVWVRLNESIPFFWMWLNANLSWKKSKMIFFTQNWTFLHMTRRIELYFSIWIKESNPVLNMIQRVVF